VKKKHFLLIALFLAQASFAQSGPTLIWNANPAGDSVTQYNVYEHIGTSFTLLGQVIPPAPLSFSLAGLPAGQHLLCVTALNARGESAKSADAILPAAVPAAPTGVKVTP
jgi:hypothetical protein